MRATRSSTISSLPDRLNTDASLRAVYSHNLVQQRLPSLIDPPVAFAHRGARAHAPENTMEAFSLALRLGATGLESDVWRTADGALVLDHDGQLRRRLRRIPYGELRRDELPDHVPDLGDLLEMCQAQTGPAIHLSLDLKGPGAGDGVVTLLTQQHRDIIDRVWLCSPDIDELIALRQRSDSVRLIHSTRVERLAGRIEAWAAHLAHHGIDGINFHHTDWNGGLVALFHRFDLVTFGWDAQFERTLRALLRMGIDGVYSDWVDRMVDAYRAEIGAVAPPSPPET